MKRSLQAPTRPLRLLTWLAVCCALGGSSASVFAFLRPVPVPDPPEESAPAAVPATPAAPAPALPEPDETRHDLFYDRSNPDLGRLQRPAEALRELPRDRDGRVDWMEALRSRAITPRATIDEQGQQDVFHLDVVMRNTREMPHVRFSHRAHTEWLDCSNCHPALFEARAGGSSITMEKIFRGRYCGVCHDRIAFVTHRHCDRCHNEPQPASAQSRPKK